MSRQRSFLALFTGGTIAVLALIMLHLTSLIPAAGIWYSRTPEFRLQTEAFLRGELAIQPVPYGHGHDWAWGNGMQQVWGLGVPLIQLPFQVLGKLVNGFGFPDRIVFLIFYLLTATLFWVSLDAGAINSNAAERLKQRLLTIPILLYALLHQAPIKMARIEFGVYQEATFYAFLWSLILFALLLIFNRRRTTQLYLLLCALAGFALNVRPTIGAYGGTTLLIAFYLAWNSKLKTRWLGLVVFLLGPAFFLLMNAIRFGSPFESGHNLGLSGAAFFEYIVKFDNPMTWVPFTSITRELFSALFFLDLEQLQAADGWLPWMVNVPRERDLSFQPFSSVELVLVLLALLVVIGLLANPKRWKTSAFRPDFQVLAVGTIWAFLSFSMLFVFYARWPGLTSRYLVDFAPAVIAGVTVISLCLIRFAYREKYLQWVTPVLGGILVSMMISSSSHLQSISTDPYSVDLNTARERLRAARSTSGPALPGEYKCGDAEKHYGIPYNNSEWDLSGDCSVSLVTTHFFEAPKCIAITLTPLTQAVDTPKEGFLDQEIEVKMGINFLKRVSEAQDGGRKTITFCSTEESTNNHRGYSTIEMISIKWVNWRNHPKIKSNPYRLLSIKKVLR